MENARGHKRKKYNQEKYQSHIAVYIFFFTLYILCIHITVYANMDKRADRIVKQYGERSASPEKRLRDKDKRRAAYYQFYTEWKWGDVQNYHLALNSGLIGIDKCVDIIAQLCL